VQVESHAFFTSALEGGEWSASCPRDSISIIYRFWEGL
jgi:hypothetical protein